MVQIRVDASELNRLAADLSGAPGRVVSAVARLTEEVAVNIERDAKMFAPVRTGNLRRSLHYELEAGGLRALIGSDVEYAGFVEFGTSRMAPRAYLGPSYDRNVPDYVTGLGRIAGESIFGR